MRSRAALTSVVVTVVLGLTSCQSDSESLAGVDVFGPRFDKPTCPSSHPSCLPGQTEAPNYHIEIVGDVHGIGDTDDRTTGVTARDFVLDDLGTFLEAHVVDGATCFTSAGYTGNLNADQQEDGTVNLRFAFNALNNKGRDARYGFFGELGEITSGVWPPDGSGTVVVFNQWSVAKEGGGGVAACSGSGAFSATMTVYELP